MTQNEYLDVVKKQGIAVYICLDCGFRGFGASVNYHEEHNPYHRIVKEDEYEEFEESLGDS